VYMLLMLRHSLQLHDLILTFILAKWSDLLLMLQDNDGSG